MKTLLNCVGLDYHEDTIRVCVMTPQGKTQWNRDVPNDARVVRDRVLMFSPPSVVALEACCGAANFAEELRRAAGRTDAGRAGQSVDQEVAELVA